ncbi:MAG: N-acetylmuramoyl-L-alanine amidase [Dehalococcoidia bacterium]|nr:N-acetylmuramoyl-L-alanine amidase [Dehalococcoidia bacterium]
MLRASEPAPTKPCASTTPGNEIWPRMYVPVKKLVVHHTATTNDYTEDEAKAEVRAVYTYHAVSLEWGDIGYNALHHGPPARQRLRRPPPAPCAGSDREVLSQGVVAGHALSHNYGSTGIAALGTYTQRGEGGKPGIQPSGGTLDAFRQVLAFEANRNHVDPHGVGDFLLFDSTWNRGLENISGHRDCNSTICPGGNLYDHLPGLRDDVATVLARETPVVSLDRHPPEDTVSGGEASYAWSSSDASRVLLCPRRLAPNWDGRRHRIPGWLHSRPSPRLVHVRRHYRSQLPRPSKTASTRSMSVPATPAAPSATSRLAPS